MLFQQLVRFALILSFAVLTLPSNSSAQTSSTGELLGQVLDPTGKGLVQASIAARNEDSSIARSTASDDEGRFAFTLLPPGSYRLEVTKIGYSQVETASV